MSDPEVYNLETNLSYSAPKELDPTKLLSFARWILISIAVLAILACTMLLKYPGSKEAALIYEQARTILPPLVTLVLGFYFGGRHTR
jgi:hypothetical protein